MYLLVTLVLGEAISSGLPLPLDNNKRVISDTLEKRELYIIATKAIVRIYNFGSLKDE